MNVSELARRLKVAPQQLRTMLPELGFDIGMRAIKIDDRTAWKIIEDWPELNKTWQKNQIEKTEEEITPGEASLATKQREVNLPAVLTVREFAAALGRPINQVIGELMKNGILAAMNERIDFTTACIIAQDLGYVVKESKESEEADVAEVCDIIRERVSAIDPALLRPRPPVVVVMGHVDHGKTRTLDAIRKTNVMAGEAGGITQHIGAYQITIPQKNILREQEIPRSARDDFAGRKVTFIDTPGHEAFTTMRSRGARVADVAILVVAADDGVQPQTVEALRIIEAAKLPYVVAVNKMDKSEADVERIKRELSEKGVIPEDWGGKTPFVPISAKAGTGIDALLDVILLVADLDKEKIVADPSASALGTVIEAHVDPGEGPVATVLVQNGTLHHNDYLAVGDSLYGRVRAMKDWAGKKVDQAPPGMPVKILGFRVAPEMGDIVETPENTKGLEIKKVIPSYKEGMSKTINITPETEKIETQTFVNVVVKADVLGSLEAILASLEKLQTPEVAVKVVAKGLGNINEAEILQAEASSAIIYGFNVAILPQVANLAREKGVETQNYKIIYELLDDIKGRLEILLKPEIIHTTLGTLKVLEVFRKEKNHAIIGGRVEEGKIIRAARIKIIRKGVEEGSGEISELQVGKRSVEEAPGGSECGLKINTRTAIEKDDLLEVYKEQKRERKLIL